LCANSGRISNAEKDEEHVYCIFHKCSCTCSMKVIRLSNNHAAELVPQNKHAR